MPVTKSAKRALRGSKKKEEINKKIIASVEKAVKDARKGKSKDLVKKALSLVDRAAKKNVIHKNKASRLASQLSKITKK